MDFVPDDVAVSPEDEWLARVTPLLTADDPHQRCNARARAAGSLSVNAYCTCEHGRCTKSCCVPDGEE
jgi:hypothetical protein